MNSKRQVKRKPGHVLQIPFAVWRKLNVMLNLSTRLQPVWEATEAVPSRRKKKFLVFDLFSSLSVKYTS